MTIWTPQNSKIVEQEGLRWIYALRLKNEETVEMLVDPWIKSSSIWELNVKTFNLIKIKCFTEYQDKEYSKEVIW